MVVTPSIDPCRPKIRPAAKSTRRLASLSSISVRFMITGVPSRKYSPMVRASLYVRGCRVVIRFCSARCAAQAGDAGAARRCSPQIRRAPGAAPPRARARAVGRRSYVRRASRSAYASSRVVRRRRRRPRRSRRSGPGPRRARGTPSLAHRAGHALPPGCSCLVRVGDASWRPDISTLAVRRARTEDCGADTQVCRAGAMAASRSPLMPAETQVASGVVRRTRRGDPASRANAAPGSAPSGATAITPASRRPGVCGDLVGERRARRPARRPRDRAGVEAHLDQSARLVGPRATAARPSASTTRGRSTECTTSAYRATERALLVWS